MRIELRSPGSPCALSSALNPSMARSYLFQVYLSTTHISLPERISLDISIAQKDNEDLKLTGPLRIVNCKCATKYKSPKSQTISNADIFSQHHLYQLHFHELLVTTGFDSRLEEIDKEMPVIDQRGSRKYLLIVLQRDKAND
jgi:hypothetical protein